MRQFQNTKMLWELKGGSPIYLKGDREERALSTEEGLWTGEERGTETESSCSWQQTAWAEPQEEETLGIFREYLVA